MKKSTMLILGLAMLMIVGTGCCGLSQEDGDVAGALDDLLLRVYLAFHQGDISKPASDDPTPVVFVVEPGETAGDIALRLKRLGLITDAELFRQLAQYEEADSKLEAGRYELRANMTMGEIIEALQRGRIEEIVVTIPEGWRVEQIAEMLGEEVGVDSAEFLDFVQGGYFDYDFLRDRPPEADLEGFLFPDTYLLPVHPTALDTIERNRKCANALFASAIRWVSSFFLIAEPSFLKAAMISFARRSAMVLSERFTEKLTSQRMARERRRFSRTSTGI